MKQRDDLLAVAQVLRTLAADARVREKLPDMPPRLVALASTIERSLAVGTWEQWPSWREWAARVRSEVANAP